MKKKIILFGVLIPLFMFQETILLNNKNFIDNSKENSIPYIPYSTESTTYSGKSMDLVENNNTSGFTTSSNSVFYMQVIDNDRNQFYNYMVDNYNVGITGLSIDYNSTSGGLANSDLSFLPTLSNLNNDVYYYSFSNSDGQDVEDINSDISLTYGSPTNTIQDTISYDDVNTEGQEKSQFVYYPNTSPFPYISVYDPTADNNVFKIDSFEDGTLTFTITVHNWDESGDDFNKPEETIGVTLINLLTENNLNKYEQYKAHLLSSDGNDYTYQISNLDEDTDYMFYSMNYSGLTVSNDEYRADYLITMQEQLNIPPDTLMISNDHPYLTSLDGSSFDMNNDSITANSIQFTLQVVDTVDNNFFNYVKNNGNKINVTLKINNTNNEIHTTATMQDENIQTNGIYNFKISGLKSNTDYEVYSIDNTDLALSSGQLVDTEIILSDDIGVVDNSFKTKTSPILYVMISIIIFLLISTMILLFFYQKERKKLKEQQRILNTNNQEV